MTIQDKVKLALRISHDLLNGEIADTIYAARQEMIRSGVSPEMANGSADLVEMAIKTYALANLLATPSDAEKYMDSFRYQVDCIRKSEVVDFV